MAQSNKLFIGGDWVDAESGKTFPVLNPATEEEIGQAALGGPADVDRAVRAAMDAFAAWARVPQSERAKIVYRIGAAIREAGDDLVDLEVREHGTPITMARGFIAAAAESAEYQASVSRALMGQVLNAFSDATVYLQRVPIGVCAVITPWNVPLMMMAAMVTPALVTGNTVVLKPASVNSLLAVKFTEVLEGVGLPAGVMNLVTGPGGSVGEALAAHPGVDMIRFTGSSETGKEIMRVASQTAKKSVMELGGNNPVIVCEDADVVKAATWQAQRHFGNSAQNCSTPGRYYVQESFYDRFVETFVGQVEQIVVGDPGDKKTTMGPMANKQQMQRVEQLIESALSEGARIALGGKRIGDKGYFLQPTVVVDVTHDMTIAREEIFGPAAAILRFSSEEEVIDLANDSEYGLVAGVWTKDVAKALRFTEQLRVDSVYINMPRIQVTELPWGGNVKQSGVGKDGAMCGLEEFTDLKMVVINRAS
ncbi:MAG: aldehyde dehydrogenase [Thermoleophilia bacterium]|nr:aldehyde dehydrogenase [Thermoleophilia bacterium]